MYDFFLFWAHMLTSGSYREQVLPKVIWEKCVTLTQLRNKVLVWDVPKFTPKTVTTLNNIRIQSVILPQYTFQTDGQTDTHRPTDGISNRSILTALTLYPIARGDTRIK